jgi:hypothetical protein
LSCLFVRCCIVYIQLKKTDVQVFSPQLCFGGPSALFVTCSQQDRKSLLRKLARRFKTDALVGPGYQGYFLLVAHLGSSNTSFLPERLLSAAVVSLAVWNVSLPLYIPVTS